MTTRRPEDSPDRVTQLEMALAAARELLAERERFHEAAERGWMRERMTLIQDNSHLRQRVEWLTSQVVTDVVRRSQSMERVQ